MTVKFEVGGTVWAESRVHRHQGRVLKVSKVGLRWVSFDRTTWKADRFSGSLYETKYPLPISLYQSEAAMAEEKALNQAWYVFGSRASRSQRPACVTHEVLAQACALLGLEKP